MNKNNAKMTKKLSFSMPTFGFLDCNMGDKITEETAILRQVTNRNVLPTLSMLFSLTTISMKIMSTEQLKKNS